MNDHAYWFRFLKERGYYYGGMPSIIRTAIDVHELLYDEEKHFRKKEAKKFLKEERKIREENLERFRTSLQGSFCYFFGNRKQGVVKIGVTKDMFRRLKEVQTGFPYNLKILGYIESRKPLKTESKMHQYYRRFNLRGEWFRLTDRIEEFLDELDNGIDFVF